jgi:DNA-binding CsgD family transcriptional regulator
MIAESPTPDLPRGAGGPSSRAAGRGSGAAALVHDPDPLARLLAAPAVAELGFAPVVLAPSGGPGAGAPVAVFVSLDRPADCRRALREAAPAISGARLVVGYGAGPEALLSAHRAHRCCDVVLRLTAAAGRPRLVHLPAADAVSAAGLSDREADVLVLLLLGLTTPALAVRLGVAGSTARSHCRAVLRKLDAPDRRALRARLLGGPDGGPDTGPAPALVAPALRFADAGVPALPRNRS